MAHGEVLPLRPSADREEVTSFVGMVVFLASWAMLFGALLFAYGYLRTHARSWPPAGLPPLPLLPGLANTGVLALSSAALHAGLGALRRGRQERVMPAVLGAVGLGLVFVAGQVLLWRGLGAAGLALGGTGPYGSVFYALTGLHALHVAVGLWGLFGVAWRVRAGAGVQGGALTPARHGPFRLWAMYWHFVGVVWLVLFVTVFCL